MTGARVFVLDNYDSFTFNLVQYLGELGATLEVERNDKITVEQIAQRAPDAVVISPGPGVPANAGISIQVVEWCARSSTPLLGVCLGHQAIGEAFGGHVVRAPSIMHGKTSQIHHTGAGVLRGLSDPFEATRYHSLVVERSTLPEVLEVTAWTPGVRGAPDEPGVRGAPDESEDVLMGFRHESLPIEGVQFHPESILTGEGMSLLANFLSIAGAGTAR